MQEPLNLEETIYETKFMITKRYNDLIERMQIDNELVSEFFIFFSRFEYALKMSEFYKEKTRNAEPDWHKFAKIIEESFITREKNSKLEKAISYLKSNPPKRQKVGPYGLEWCALAKEDGEGEIAWLLILARTVRNNLFHGGKYPFEPIRDEELLKSSLIILDSCLDRAENVRKCFEKN